MGQWRMRRPARVACVAAENDESDGRVRIASPSVAQA